MGELEVRKYEESDDWQARITYEIKGDLSAMSIYLAGFGSSRTEAIQNLKQAIAECPLLDNMHFFLNYPEFDESEEVELVPIGKL